MKKPIVIFLAVLTSASEMGQGIIIFNNRVPEAGINAPVFKPDGVTGAGAGTQATAQLFLVTGSVRNPSYAPLFPTATFRRSPAGAQAYIIPPQESGEGVVLVPGVGRGATVTVVLRAWEGPSYDTASVFGQSNPVTINAGFGDPISIPYLVGLQGFTMVPEPSVAAFGLLGIAAFLYRRRSNGI